MVQSSWCIHHGAITMGQSKKWSIETRPSEANDASFSDFFIFHFFNNFFIFLTTFSFFHSPLPPFLPVPPSSSSLLHPRPALSKSFRIRKSPSFIDFDESISAQRTPTDKASYRDADASKNLINIC